MLAGIDPDGPRRGSSAVQAIHPQTMAVRIQRGEGMAEIHQLRLPDDCQAVQRPLRLQAGDVAVQRAQADAHLVSQELPADGAAPAAQALHQFQ